MTIKQLEAQLATANAEIARLRSQIPTVPDQPIVLNWDLLKPFAIVREGNTTVVRCKATRAVLPTVPVQLTSFRGQIPPIIGQDEVVETHSFVCTLQRHQELVAQFSARQNKCPTA